MSGFFIGNHQIPHQTLLAPMAGITDRPFRRLCRELGAAFTVSEMLSCDLSLLKTAKTQFRMKHQGEPEPIAVQIAGSEPEKMAQAARFNQQNGAQIIDINMGCPQKKVARKKCGSALLEHPKLVQKICHSVVQAVNIPVTLKIRLGIDQQQKNAPTIAKIAEQSGIQALFIHGRTKVQKFSGNVDYQTIAECKAKIDIPVIANGDIDSPQKAKTVLQQTGCDGIMIGRAAQGNPWIFKQIKRFLEIGEICPQPTQTEILRTMYRHIAELHRFYGEDMGCRMARKHIKWFMQRLPFDDITRKMITIDHAEEQLQFINQNLLNR